MSRLWLIMFEIKYEKIVAMQQAPILGKTRAQRLVKKSYDTFCHLIISSSPAINHEGTRSCILLLILSRPTDEEIQSRIMPRFTVSAPNPFIFLL